MKKILALLLSLLLLASFLTGCSKSKSDNEGTAPVASASVTGMDDAYYQYAPEEGRDAGSQSEGAPAEDFTNSNGTLAQTGPDIERKIIKNAKADLETEDVLRLYDTLLEEAKRMGGYEFSREIQEDSSDYKTVFATLKLPPDQLDAFLTYAGEQAKIINQAVSAEDITEEYYDTQTRLKTLRTSLDKYYEFLAKAESIEDILRVQGSIDQLTQEIELLEGQLKRYNALTDLAELSLRIYEARDPGRAPKEIEWNSLSLSDMWNLIKRGVVSVLGGLFSALQWIVVALATISPVLLILAIALLIILRATRKERRARKERRKAQQALLQPPPEEDSPEP